jgi:hypothetical protein
VPLQGTVQKPQPFRVETAMQLSEAHSLINSLRKFPGPLTKQRHKRVKTWNMAVSISKGEPIPEPVRGEICYASEEEVLRPASEKDICHASQANQPPVIIACVEAVPTSLQGEINYFFSDKDRPKLRRMKRGVSVSRMPM